MAKIRVGINGMGRIGRTVLREYFNRNINSFEIVAVNNPGAPDVYVHLFKYDSVHGRFDGEVKFEGQDLVIKGKKIKFYACKDPKEIPWAEQKVDFVIDATGKFKDKAGLSGHLGSTVKKVMMCAPGKELDATFVMGVNHKSYDHAKHNVISNASCTTNCLAPVVKVLNDKWGVDWGQMNTIHSYTSDQLLLDGSHSDLRRARAAALSMIPTSTGAAKTVGVVIPELKGKLDGLSIRVPTPNVSLVDFTCLLKKPATAQEVNAAMKEAASGPLKGILDYCEEQLVSTDYMRTRASSAFDATLTKTVGPTLKVIAWYDNEVGFSNRVLDLVDYVGSNY
jgi:glyceraldehyde-3-phosphate dehydrogenase type I